jgi:hypothetical protein
VGTTAGETSGAAGGAADCESDCEADCEAVATPLAEVAWAGLDGAVEVIASQKKSTGSISGAPIIT